MARGSGTAKRAIKQLQKIDANDAAQKSALHQTPKVIPAKAANPVNQADAQRFRKERATREQASATQIAAAVTQAPAAAGAAGTAASGTSPTLQGMWDSAKGMYDTHAKGFVDRGLEYAKANPWHAAGIYAGGAVGLRMLQGGTLTRDADGRRDIVGIPLM